MSERTIHGNNKSRMPITDRALGTKVSVCSLMVVTA